jgi:putative spermidine/putrescine transport system substrate-binding protein
MRTSRRNFNKLMAAGALSSFALPMPALRAQSGQVVVGTYGGDYQATLDRAVAQGVLAGSGLNVVYDLGSDSPRKMKIRSEARLPRGNADVQVLPAAGCYEMWQAGLLEELDESKIPNYQYIQEKIRTPYSVPHIQSGRVLIYNRDRITADITSFQDMWRPELAEGVGLVDIHFHYNIETAALAHGGSMTNYEPGYDALLELKELGARITPTLETMGQSLQSGEILMCPMWQARSVQWREAGIPLGVCYPTEGIVSTVNAFCIPKNATNKDGAYAFINAILEPEAQRAFSEVMGYGPTTTNADLPPELAEAVAIPDDQLDNLLIQDFEYFASEVNDMKDWWERVFKA